MPRAIAQMQDRREHLRYGAILVALVVAIVGGYFGWRHRSVASSVASGGRLFMLVGVASKDDGSPIYDADGRKTGRTYYRRMGGLGTVARRPMGGYFVFETRAPGSTITLRDLSLR